MSTYADLLKTCAEFQENFAVLNGKFTSLQQNLNNETERNARLREELAAASKKEEKLLHEMNTLRKEVDALQGYKDKYTAAAVEVEHLRGRVENARHGVADATLEHETEKEQLKNQIADLTKRIEVTSGSGRLHEMKKQMVELEERCAAQQSQLTNDRENFSQRLLAAHNALREQQSRNLELEQRYRSMDGEVSEMRSALRRSVDLQNEAALLKDRYASEAALAQQATETLRSEASEVRARLAQVHEDHQEEVEDLRRAAEEERQRLRERVASLTAAQQDALSAAQKERDRCSHLQRTVQQQVDSARGESTAEVTALRRAAAQEKEECQRLQWQGEHLQEQLQDARRATEQQESRNAALQTQVQKLEQDLDRAVQREAWVAAEKKHTEEQLAAAQQQLHAVSEVAARHEQATFDLDRLRMLLQSRDAELQDARRAAQSVEGRLADLEDAAAARLQALRREARQAKKLARSEAAKGDVLRRKLVESLVHQEAARTSCYLTGGTGSVPLVLSSGGGGGGSAAAAAIAAEYPSSDVINLLRSQNEQAILLHNKVLELSK